MCDTPTKPSHTARNTGIGVAAALLLYALSVGPVARLAQQGIISPKVSAIVYAPLIWLHDHDKILAKPILEWYVGSWTNGVIMFFWI
jgi:hypothetical protein